MLLRFVIEPAAFLDKRYLDDASDASARLKGLQKFWINHGVWVKPESHGMERVLDAYPEAFEPKFKQLFRELFLDEEPLYRQERIEDCLPFEQITTEAELKHHAQQSDFVLALLEPVRAQELGLSQGNFCACPQLQCPELTCLHLVEHACQVDEVQRLGEADTDANENPAVLWEKRLQPYAEYHGTREIVIADPYCTRGIEGKPNPNEGLPNLLKHLFSLERGRNGRGQNKLTVTIYGSYDNSYHAKDEDRLAPIREALHNKLDEIDRGQSRIRNVRAYLLPRPDPRGKFHDRYIRIDDNVFALGQGTAVFNHLHSPRRPKGPRHFQLKSIGDTKRIEKDLRDCCKGKQEYWWKPRK